MTSRAAAIVRAVWMGSVHFVRSHGMVYSAAVAYNLLLSAIPVLFLVFAAASVVIGTGDLPFNQLARLLKDTFPYGAQALLPALEGLFTSGTTFGILGTVLLLFSSYSATDAVHASLVVMLGARRRKRFRRSAAFHGIFVLALMVLTFAAILVPPLWKGLSMLTKGMSAGLDAAFHILLQGVADVVLAGILFAGSALTYRYLSPWTVRWENALAGSAGFCLLLYSIKWGFTFYVRKFSRLDVIYGSLFGVICFIIVAYLFAAAYLFCASIIGVLEREDGKGAPPGTKAGAAKG